ncbi:EAL domain-containing protein [Streptomyces californicus]
MRDYRAAFNAAALPMGVIDGRGQVVRANEALGGLLGAPAAVLAGGARPASCSTSPPTTAPGTATARSCWAAAPGSAATAASSPDGRSLWAEITVVPMTGASATKPARVLLTVADVSDRRAASRSGCATSRCTIR